MGTKCQVRQNLKKLYRLLQLYVINAKLAVMRYFSYQVLYLHLYSPTYRPYSVTKALVPRNESSCSVLCGLKGEHQHSNAFRLLLVLNIICISRGY